MKKQIYMGVNILFMNSFVIAQTTKDSAIVIKKNELGIDLIPGIKKLSGNSYTNNIFQVGLQYKRRISKKWYFRFGVTELFYGSQYYYNYGRLDSLNATTKMERYSKYKSGPETRLNTGMEYRWGKKSVKFFTGTDFCYSNNKSIDYTYGRLIPRNGSTPYHDPFSSDGDSLISSSLYMRNTFGLLPFIGMQYHFSKRFFFSMQFGINVQYHFYNYASIKYHDFYVPDNILNNFSLFYKF